MEQSLVNTYYIHISAPVCPQRTRRRTYILIWCQQPRTYIYIYIFKKTNRTGGISTHSTINRARYYTHTHRLYTDSYQLLQQAEALQTAVISQFNSSGFGCLHTGQTLIMGNDWRCFAKSPGLCGLERPPANLTDYPSRIRRYATFLIKGCLQQTQQTLN